jgi:integrase
MKGCRPLSDHEVRLIQRSFGGRYALRDKAMFVLGVKSGFRISELLSLRLGDVLQYGRLVDRVTVQRRYMKRKVEGRTVLLHPEAKTALAAWLMQLQARGLVDPRTYVFLSQKGANRPITRRQAWEVLHEPVVTNELSGTLGTHMMRKTFADRIYERSGRNLIATKHALGHKHVNSTDAYLSFRQEEIDTLILAL